MRERLRPTDRRADAGTTLIELLVAMTVFSVAVGLAFSAVILSMQWSRETQQSADATTELRNALAQIDRQVRSGNVLFSPQDETTSGCQGGPADEDNPSGSCMRVFTQANGEEKCVQWQVLADGTAPGGTPVHTLRTRSWSTDWQTVTGSVSDWSVVARNLALGVADQMPFTLLGASSPYKSRSLQVHLQSLDQRQGKPVAIDSTLTGRNTTYGYDSGQCTPVPPSGSTPTPTPSSTP